MTDGFDNELYEEPITARQELNELAETLREAVENEKEWKALKEEVRGPFFELISEVVREEIPLATLVETIPNDGADVEEWCKRNYPEYRVIAIHPEGDEIRVTLQENETLKKYEFEAGGYKFGRTIRMKGAGFDAESFWNELDRDAQDQEDAKLLQAMRSCINKQEIITYEIDEAKAIEVMADYPETVVLFQKYQHPGTPEVALLPIRPVKEEEPSE